MATTMRDVISRPRTIKKLEKPRPLKISQRSPTTETRITTVDDIVSLIDNVAMHLNNGYYDQSLQSNIVTMCNHLKLYSHDLELIYKDQLDRAFIAIRNGSQDERLDISTRVHLLELIELRAKQWHHNESMNAYYSHKLSNIDSNDLLSPETPNNLLTPTLMNLDQHLSSSPPLLGPGEVIKNSGKFSKPTRIPGKNYCKDEIVIRNSDSGKVNPGAKERLVQITGASEDKIHYAKDLIKDTIQRNASPVRLEQGGREKNAIGGSSSSLNSSASDESNRLQQQQQQNSSFRSSLLHSLSTNDASIGEYKYTVTVGPHSLKITGSNLDLVRAAKLALDEYFSEESEHVGSGVEYFTFDEESSFTPVTPTTPHTPLSAGQINFSRRNVSYESGSNLETEKIKEACIPEIEPKKNDSTRELSYEFLMQCAKSPYAKRPPVDWDRLQKEFPTIVRKVQEQDVDANNRVRTIDDNIYGFEHSKSTFYSDRTLMNQNDYSYTRNDNNDDHYNTVEPTTDFFRKNFESFNVRDSRPIVDIEKIQKVLRFCN